MRLGILVHVHISLGCAKIQGKETKSKYLERPMQAHTFENMHACPQDCTRVVFHFTYSHKKLSVLPACVYAHMPIYGPMMVIEISPPSLPCSVGWSNSCKILTGTPSRHHPPIPAQYPTHSAFRLLSCTPMPSFVTIQASFGPLRQYFLFLAKHSGKSGTRKWVFSETYQFRTFSTSLDSYLTVGYFGIKSLGK